MIKVASYCRVSTDKEDQANSFASQQRYFREYIGHHSDWELYEMYADEGITGTSTKKRTQFNRMISDAREGKFQLIVTKEVSRFSRNILDTITYTRALKDIGVEVQFLLDGIHTMSPDAELYLAIMASMAQEESRKISSRVVWGQTRQMEKGIVFGHSLLGYDVKCGRLTVNPEGAELVRLIFQKYAVERISTCEIARFLIRECYHTHTGSNKWSANTVIKILKNEKYVGDLIQKKSYTPNFLTHEKRKNTGEVPLIRLENHHEPIIDRELWNAAQECLAKNNKHAITEWGHSNRYVFSGLIKCGECGASFVGRFKYLKDGTKVRRWRCGTTVAHGAAACSIGKLLRDDDAMYMAKTAVKSLPLDISWIVSNITTLVLNAIQASGQGTHDHVKRLHNEISSLLQRKKQMLDSFFSGDITKADMLSMNLHYDEQLEILHTRADEAYRKQMDSQQKKSHIESKIEAILNGSTESEVFYKNILHSLTVFKDRHMELRLNHLSMVFQFSE